MGTRLPVGATGMAQIVNRELGLCNIACEEKGDAPIDTAVAVCIFQINLDGSMKMNRLKPALLVAAVVSALLIWRLAALGVSSAQLGFQVSGGQAKVTISGPSGSAWAIQYATSLAPTNVWTAFTNVTLSGAPSTVADPAGLAGSARFYRAIELSIQMLTNSVTNGFIWISPGTYVMGSPTNEPGRDTDETQHTVTLTQGFYLGKFLVTQGQYLSVIGFNPSYFNGVNGGTNYGVDTNRPVETVSWYAASDYCAELTQTQQLSGQIPTNWAYRLPTESEWEYACRAGTTTEFSYGQDPDYTYLANYAWYSANSGDMVHDGGLLLPNPWGLFDMEGDVFEWCEDWYGAYPNGSVVDPQGPADGDARVFRGGSWAYGPEDCRCAGRYSSDPTTKFNFVGFRVVLAPSS
jgi:formylglycine-generating enzyme required for sulfatase activity